MHRATTGRAFAGLAFFGLAAVCAFAAAPQPAFAQFGTIFGGEPPRPPANVPSRPDAIPAQPPQALPAPSNLPPSGGRGVAVQSQPLPPPPGPPAAPLDTRPQQSGLPPQQQQQPQQQPGPLGGLPPGQRQPRGTPQPANANAPAPDEGVAEPPTQKIANNSAVFSGLDKITGRIISFDVALNETVQFGALQVTPRVCYTRPPTELPMTDGFVEVSEVTLQGEVRRIFNGWMYAASPGLHGVEHSIYDVWLTDCKEPQTKVAEEPAPANAAAQQRAARPAAPQRPTPAPRPAPPRGTLVNPR
jgi:hypothetical protein